MSVLPIEQLKQIPGPLNWKQLPQERFESIAIYDVESFFDVDHELVDRIPSRPVKCLTFDGIYYIAIPIEDYNNIFNMDIEGEPELVYEYSDDLDKGCDGYSLTPDAVDDEFVYCTMDDLDETVIEMEINQFVSYVKYR